MGTVTGPPPQRSDDRHDAEALEALIEEARQRARRRRRGYAAAALAAGVLGFWAFDNDRDSDGANRSSDSAEPREAGAGVTDGKWRAASGLDGGSISVLAVDPQQPKNVYAALWSAGVFKSADGGRSWRQMDVGSDVTRVDALAIAPGEPQTVYVGSARGVSKTTNGGRSWQATSSSLLGKETADQREHRGYEGYVTAVIVDRRDADVAYAGTQEKGLFKTEDGGRSWQSIGPRARVTTLAFQPGTSEVIYAGGYVDVPGGGDQGVYRSRDGGATWDSAGLRGKYVLAVAVDPKHPQTIYAGAMVDGDGEGTVRGGIFKTTDGGASWRRTKRMDGPTALAIDPHDPDVVYAESWGNLLKTVNGGRTWQSFDVGGSQALALDPRKPETVYVGTGDNVEADAGVAKSLNGGRSWRPMNAGLTAARVSALAVAPGGRGTVYAALPERGIFKRVGGSWRPANTGLNPDAMVRTVAVDPRHPANVFAATDNGVFRSTNGGARWRASSMTQPVGGWPMDGGRFSALAVDPENSKMVHAIAVNDATRSGGGVTGIYESLALKSIDGGRNWPLLASVQSVTVPATPRGFGGGGLHTSPLMIDPRDPRVLYAGGAGVSKSTDQGGTWRSSGLRRQPVLALAVDRDGAGIVYAGTDAGAFKSTDAGASWQRLRGPLDKARVEALAIDPEDHRTVYAGTDSGVSWTTDGGASWHRFTHLPLRPFHAVAVDRSAGVLYAGAYGGGIYELKLAR